MRPARYSPHTPACIDPTQVMPCGSACTVAIAGPRISGTGIGYRLYCIHADTGAKLAEISVGSYRALAGGAKSLERLRHIPLDCRQAIGARPRAVMRHPAIFTERVAKLAKIAAKALAPVAQLDRAHPS